MARGACGAWPWACASPILPRHTITSSFRSVASVRSGYGLTVLTKEPHHCALYMHHTYSYIYMSVIAMQNDVHSVCLLDLGQ